MKEKTNVHEEIADNSNGGRTGRARKGRPASINPGSFLHLLGHPENRLNKILLWRIPFSFPSRGSSLGIGSLLLFEKRDRLMTSRDELLERELRAVRPFGKRKLNPKKLLFNWNNMSTMKMRPSQADSELPARPFIQYYPKGGYEWEWRCPPASPSGTPPALTFCPREVVGRSEARSRR